MTGAHRISVQPCRNGRKYQYVCSCGARGWETESYGRAQQMGAQHAATASGKGRG
ncbi:hypothetical protein ACFYZJ_37770 [Streptomyces sp. NPDC001848]|uniref:hypothetical protein n=1 Tax=Streptomyces sp. NPDC001848 TaxID=3364618 RepID=UPI00368A6ED9